VNWLKGQLQTMDINDAAGRLFKMVEEMSQMTLNEPDIFELAEEIHEYFEYGIEPMDID